MFLALFTIAQLLLAEGALGLFSVHDDVLAFPQYDIHFPDSYITEEDAAAYLARISSSSSSSLSSSLAPSSTPTSISDPDPENEQAEEYHQIMWLNKRRYLCTIPVVKPPPPMSATEKELSKVEEEKELARATSRGWELLSDLEGKCLYFVSGWWSYSFCHNREVRQFHQLPMQEGDQWPPAPDPETQSYVLGQVLQGGHRTKAEKGELQATGELRFLVQKLGSGTICDLTGKERKIEVQFHCNSHGPDRIGWIKEVQICSYLMVIYTPRLCHDEAFLPPRENRANRIQCKEVMSPQRVQEWNREQEANARIKQAKTQKLLEEAVQNLEIKGGKLLAKDEKKKSEKDGRKATEEEEDEVIMFIQQEL